MFAPPSTVEWLQFLYEDCCTLPQELLDLRPLDDTADHLCLRLAREFVGCNLIIDLMQLFFPLHEGDLSPLGRLDFAPPLALCDWMHDGQATPAERTDLLTAADGFDRNPALREQPWRRVHCWLAVEAMLRHLGEAAPTVPADRARAAFYESLSPCGVAAPALRDSFNRWWQLTARQLTAALRDHWQRFAHLGWPGFTSVLAYQLDAPPDAQDALARLLHDKNFVLNGRLNDARFAPPLLPVSMRWVRDVTARLLAAVEEDEPMPWGPPDPRRLAALLPWATTHAPQALELSGAAALEPLTVEAAGPLLPALARNLHRSWRRLVPVLRSTIDPACPADHITAAPRRRLVQEVFFDPLTRPDLTPGTFFATWLVSANRYWGAV